MSLRSPSPSTRKKSCTSPRTRWPGAVVLWRHRHGNRVRPIRPYVGRNIRVNPQTQSMGTSRRCPAKSTIIGNRSKRNDWERCSLADVPGLSVCKSGLETRVASRTCPAALWCSRQARCFQRLMLALKNTRPALRHCRSCGVRHDILRTLQC